MRFDYDPPSKVLLVATDWRLIFWDGSINQENVIPISKTPLGYLLGDKVQLGDAYEVTHVDQRPAETDVTVIGKGAPDQGSVTLTFSTQPMQLRRWSVVDPQGLTTRVILSDLKTGQPLDPELFRWHEPSIMGPPKD